MPDLGPMPPGVAQANVNHQFVALLERTLADAKAGKIIGGALVLAENGTLETHTVIMFPPHCAPLVVAGLRFVETEIIAMVREQQRRGPSILRAAGLPRQ